MTLKLMQKEKINKNRKKKATKKAKEDNKKK